MSNDVKLTVGVCVIVVAIFGSAVLVSHVMIELAGVARADLQALRESMEAIACGELARNDNAVAGIELSNRPRQWPPADRPMAIARPPGCLAEWPLLRWEYCRVYPSLARAMLTTSPEIILADRLPAYSSARAASADARSKCAPRPRGQIAPAQVDA